MSQLIKVALGTTSASKIRFVQEVAEEMGIVASLIPVEVESGVSEQPLTSEETQKGSINRALHALQIEQSSQISLGIEIGYFQNSHQQYEILCWASICTRELDVYSARSTSFLLPMYHQTILRQGLPLGEYVQQYVQMSTSPVQHYVASIISDRAPFIKDSVRDVLIRYFLREEFIHATKIT